MNSGLLRILVFMGRPLADLQSYGQGAFTLWGRLVSATQMWLRAAGAFSGPALVATAISGTAALLTLAGIVLLWVRTRREARKLREELAKQVARAEVAESANVAKADFLASMSHQIRTPLNAIVGFTELALKTNLDPEMRDNLDTVRTSADWLMHTVNDVLEFSRIEAGKLQLDNVPFSIADCILSSMKIVEREAAAKKLVTGCKIDPELPQVVCGDPIRLRHVIANLVDNAVRFTTTGSVILSAVLKSDSADDVLIGVTVTDTGIGIPPAKRPLIFEAFQHVDGGGSLKSHASVLGLAISRRLVELMGGTMDFTSQLGAGSTFEFTARFEKQKTGAGEAGVSLHAPESIGVKELSILVVEDNAVNRSLITKVLESAGHRVWAATNGKEAVHHVHSEAFDLILMDMEMPDLDGLEATRLIRDSEAPGLHVPIYALTAHAMPSDRDKCFEVGMDGFLTKPIAVDEVLQLVSKLSAGAPPAGAAARGLDVAAKPPAVSLPTEKGIAIECADNPFSSKYFRKEIEAAAEIAGPAAENGDLRPDSSENAFASESISIDPGSLEADEACDIAIDQAGKLLIADPHYADSHQADSDQADSDEDALLEVEQSAEIVSVLAIREPSHGVSDDSGPAANGRLSAPRGLALLQATSQLTRQSPSWANQDDPRTPATTRNPFEEARKALSKSRFDVRVIHNDGDPSDRNLI